MDDLTTECSFESQATWVIYMLGLFCCECYPWVCLQLGTGRHPVVWCRNYMSVLYVGIKLYLAVTSHAVASRPSQPRVWPCKMITQM